MDSSPLVTEQIDAGARFLLAFQKDVPVQVAFWIKEQEDGHWFLFVASDQITDANSHRADREVNRIWLLRKDPHFNPMQGKVIGADKPRAKAILAFQERSPGRSALRFHDGRLVEQGYIYPSDDKSTFRGTHQ